LEKRWTYFDDGRSSPTTYYGFTTTGSPTAYSGFGTLFT
jgi:hypothetical protein